MDSSSSVGITYKGMLEDSVEMQPVSPLLRALFFESSTSKPNLCSSTANVMQCMSQKRHQLDKQMQRCPLQQCMCAAHHHLQEMSWSSEIYAGSCIELQELPAELESTSNQRPCKDWAGGPQLCHLTAAHVHASICWYARMRCSSWRMSTCIGCWSIHSGSRKHKRKSCIVDGSCIF